MNKQDTAEAIKEAKMIHQSSLSEAQILLSLELFYMLGQKEEMKKERDRRTTELECLEVEAACHHGILAGCPTCHRVN